MDLPLCLAAILDRSGDDRVRKSPVWRASLARKPIDQMDPFHIEPEFRGTLRDHLDLHSHVHVLDAGPAVFWRGRLRLVPGRTRPNVGVIKLPGNHCGGKMGEIFKGGCSGNSGSPASPPHLGPTQRPDLTTHSDSRSPGIRPSQKVFLPDSPGWIVKHQRSRKPLARTGPQQRKMPTAERR